MQKIRTFHQAIAIQQPGRGHVHGVDSPKTDGQKQPVNADPLCREPERLEASSDAIRALASVETDLDSGRQHSPVRENIAAVLHCRRLPCPGPR